MTTNRGCAGQSVGAGKLIVCVVASFSFFVMKV